MNKVNVKMKKILIFGAVALALCAALAALSSCETGNAPTPSEAAGTTSEKEPAHEHSFGEWTLEKAPTCTEEGVEERVCACGDIETRVIPARGHIYYNQATFTWEENKATAEVVCAVCLKKELLQASVEETARHEAACVEDGEITYTATLEIGGYTFTDTTDLPLAHTGHRFENGVCSVCGLHYEEEPPFGTQAWLEWLINYDALFYSDARYKMCFGGGVYVIHDHGAFEVSRYSGEPQFVLNYMFDPTEVDASENVNTDAYDYIFELWYRDTAEYSSGIFKRVVTAPSSAYVWNDGVQKTLYRFPVYDEGMNDMKLMEDGSPREYEIMFLIYNSKTISPETLVCWKQDWIKYTEEDEMHIQEAKELGIIG